MDKRPEVSSSLDSSLLKEVIYDPFMSVMTVHFKNGGVYEYLEVPEETYNNLLKSSSTGKFFHLNVKNKFQFLRRR